MEWEGEKVSQERKRMNILGVISILQLVITLLFAIFDGAWWAEALIIICACGDFFNFGVGYKEWAISEEHKGGRR